MYNKNVIKILYEISLIFLKYKTKNIIINDNNNTNLQLCLNIINKKFPNPNNKTKIF